MDDITITIIGGTIISISSAVIGLALFSEAWVNWRNKDKTTE